MFVIFTDTDTDITPIKAKEYEYNLISMPYSIDGKEVFPYQDFTEFKCHEYYNMLRGGIMPLTSGISSEMYINYFEPFFKDGYDILYVHFSKAMTSTFQAMDMAIEELKEKYPERKIYTIDTKAITLGSYLAVCEIGKMYKEGKSIEEIINWANIEVDKFATYFFVTDLKFFRRSGRVKAFSAIMGNIIGIHPIIHMDSDGVMKSLDKARGLKNTLAKILNYVDELGDNVKNYNVAIGHSDSIDVAKLLEKELKKKFGEDLNVEIVEVNPTAGAHCGPDGVGVSFHAKHR